MASPSPRRLVLCTGTIQLITAVAVLRQIRAEQPDAPAQEDWLVIAQLTAPSGTEAQFARFIQELAERCWPWRKIIFLDRARLAFLEELSRQLPPAEFRVRYREFLTLPAVDTLLLGLNWLPINELALLGYPEARRECFGDGLGLYYPEEYWMPGTPPKSDPRAERADWRELHQGYFITAGTATLPRPPMPWTLRNPLDLLAQLHEIQDALPLPVADDLAAKLACRPFVLLMPSNFSETRRFTQDDEITLYLDHLRREPYPAGAPLLLKPHPRDSREKITALAQALREQYGEVHVLDDPSLYYMPMEILLLRLGLGSDPAAARELCPAVYTYSSACLSLALLWGLRVHLGFGVDVVQSCFREDMRATRLVQERDLGELMAEFRKFHDLPTLAPLPKAT